MSMQDHANPGKYPAELRTDWKGLDIPTNVRLQVLPDFRPEDSASMWAAQEMLEKYRLNVRQAYDSLISDIPQILRFESEAVESIYWRKTPMNWDIYTDDLETDFTNVVNLNPETVALFAAVAPSWSPSIEKVGLAGSKDLHQVALQELRVFIDNFVAKAVVTGQDECMDGKMDWCVAIEEFSKLDPDGDQVISSQWKTELTLKPFLKLPPENVVSIQAHSRFHLNDEGKIYRHSIDNLDFRLNQESVKPEDAELFLAELAGP